ncbi:major facilitator superfamily domain-containing protein [Aspergillus venezuelensis]
MRSVFEKARSLDIVREMTVPLFSISLYASVSDIPLRAMIVQLNSNANHEYQLGGLSFGIDNNYWSGLLGMTTFKNDFGVYDPSTSEYIIPTSWQSAGTGPPMAGMAFGALLSGFVGSHLGRVPCFQAASVIAAVGIIIQATAKHSYWQIVAGRIVACLALGLLANVVPAYQAECAPRKIRGGLVNCSNWGVYERTDQWAYRLAILLQLVAPLILGIGSFFMPESPRWLIGRGRDAEALEILKLLRRGSSMESIEEETAFLIAAEEESRASLHNSWIECFKRKNLRRTLIIIGIGIQDTYKTQILLSLSQALACAFGFYLPDRFGRRPVMICAAIMAACMYTVGSITGYDLADDQNAMKGALAALFIWQVFLSVGWSSCVWIMTAEAATLLLREKTIMIGTFVGFCVSILVSFVNPYMQNVGYGGLEGRIGFVYGSFSVATAVWSFFLLPETGKRSLEELDKLFERRVSTRGFSRKLPATSVTKDSIEE